MTSSSSSKTLPRPAPQLQCFIHWFLRLQRLSIPTIIQASSNEISTSCFFRWALSRIGSSVPQTASMTPTFSTGSSSSGVSLTGLFPAQRFLRFDSVQLKRFFSPTPQLQRFHLDRLSPAQRFLFQTPFPLNHHAFKTSAMRSITPLNPLIRPSVACLRLRLMQLEATR